MKKILITGGAGFIGSHLCLKLRRMGYEVVVLDTLSPQIHGHDAETSSSLYQAIRGHAHFIRGSVTDRSVLERALNGVDIVVHLAAETGTGQSMYEIEKYCNINTQGTAILLDILTNGKHSVKKVIVASSRAIYGEGKYHSQKYGVVYPAHRSVEQAQKGQFEVTYLDDNAPLEVLPTDEQSKIHPSSVYGITKQNQEQLVMTVCPTVGIAPVAFRYQNVYGPGQSLKNPYTGLLSVFSTQLLNGESLAIFEDGRESRDFVYIDDVVDATILGIEAEAANGNVFNVGSGVPVDVLTVAKLLIKHLAPSARAKVTGNFRVGDIRHCYADLALIARKLGFKPKFGFEEGIAAFASWVKSQKVENSRFSHSITEMRSRGLFQ